ncbi:hypothetical protein HN236_19065 [Acinetobacter baumannii]|uniref:hypothetical protein n=1 Tax=Acinetobacter baumannii TaxID=470 RepID=UPI001F54E0BB|nr:hypothetical protein [Acinetobacter baumannii]MBF6693541.1 hypothetical protein [Acinetobacter baumannii]MBF6830156.1 hypothetical protein [Acinetobacter baumannii]
MLILDQFKQADLSEKIAAFTSTVILIGISYKLGYYFTRLLDSLWIIQFFNVFDLAYSSLRLLILYFLILVLHDKVFVMGRALLHKDLKCKAPLIEPNLRRNLGKWST